MPSGKWQISTRGGGQVRWNRNGRELFYLSPDGRLMAVPIRITPDGKAIETASPQALFPWPGVDLGRQGTVLPPYAVSKDGQRHDDPELARAVKRSGSRLIQPGDRAA